MQRRNRGSLTKIPNGGGMGRKVKSSLARGKRVSASCFLGVSASDSCLVPAELADGSTWVELGLLWAGGRGNIWGKKPYEFQTFFAGLFVVVV